MSEGVLLTLKCICMLVGESYAKMAVFVCARGDYITFRDLTPILSREEAHSTPHPEDYLRLIESGRFRGRRVEC